MSGYIIVLAQLKASLTPTLYFESLIAMHFPKLANLFSKKAPRNGSLNGSSQIYGTVVTQARKSALYANYLVPDTVIGRYDMLALHVFLLNRRLKHTPGENAKGCNELSQEVFDLFIIDLERGLRELGFADTSVHKRKKRMVRSYYALIEEFDSSISTADIKQLSQMVEARYFDKIVKSKRAAAAKNMANYMSDTADFLASQSDEKIMSGELHWPTNTEVTNA